MRMGNMIHLSKDWVDLAVRNNTIPKANYSKYDVKRGLRNSDGSGVLVGLTEIGDVHGFDVSEMDIRPVEGELCYRGISVGDLVRGFQKEERHGFEETAYLLLFGQLPTTSQLRSFRGMIDECMPLPGRFNEDMILSAPSRDVMNKLARSVLALYSYDDKADDTSIGNVLRHSIELVARIPVLIAYGYCAMQHYYGKKALHIRYPKPGASIAENFLHLIGSSKKVNPLEAAILDLSLVLHAEHGGGNNSSFTVHVVSSSATDTYSAIAAAIGALKGPKHGGANIRVVEMMDHIKSNVKDWTDMDEISAYLERILNREVFDRSGLIYGIGHAVYTLSDPRAEVFKEKIRELVAVRHDNLEKELALYEAVEEIAPKVIRRVLGSSRRYCANVDFYSGFAYRMMGIPPEVFTPVFAMARVAGWCAHRIEELVSGGRIIRPAYKSISRKRRYTALAQRKKAKSWGLQRILTKKG